MGGWEGVPRDKNGQWTTGTGAGSGKVLGRRALASRRQLDQDARNATKKAERQVYRFTMKRSTRLRGR